MSDLLLPSAFRRLSRVVRRGVLALVVLVLASPAFAQTTSLGTWSIGEVEYELAGPFTWAADPSTPLPPGLSIRTGEGKAPWFNPSATAGLIGIATTPGTYTFNLLRDGVAVPYQMKVSALSDTDNWTSPDAFVGVAYSRQLHADNALGPVTWAPNGSLPPGMTLSPTGLLSGTPTTSGFYQVNFSIGDGVDTVYRGISLNVYSVRITTPGLLPTGTTGSAYSVTLDAAGGTAPYQFTSSSMPGGLTLSAGGTISGTPTFGGTWNFDVSVVDSLGISYTKRMSAVAINGVPQLPTLTPYGGQLDDCTVGVACQRGLSVNGTGGPFTYTVSGLPNGMRLMFGEGNLPQWISPQDPSIEGSPTASGNYSITITATGADGGSVTNTFALHVRPMWLYSGPVNGFLNEAYSSFLRVIGGTLPYTVTVLEGRLPNGLTLDMPTMTVSGIPTENGTFSLWLRVTDAVGTSVDVSRSIFIGSHTSTITLQSSDDLGSFLEGQSLSRTVSACCAPSYLWTNPSGSLPPGVSLAPSTGVLSGTPPAGSSGTYTFVLKVADATNAANFAQRQFSLRVTNVVVASSSNSLFANVGTFFTTTLTASGGTGHTFTLEPRQYLPPGLALAAGGTISGTPTASGRYTVTVRATNAAGAYATISVTIAVYPAGVAPPLQHNFGGTFSTVPFGVRTYQISNTNATGGTPPYVYALTPGAPEIPGMRVQNGQPLPTNFSASQVAGYLGVSATAGNFTTSIRVADAAGQVFDRSLQLTVVAHNLKTFSPPRATAGQFYTFTLSTVGGVGPFLFSATGMPGGLALSTAGVISGTPTGGGASSPQVTITDLGTGAVMTTGITISVDAYAIATAGVLPAATVNAAYTTALSAPGCGAGCTWSIVSGGAPSGLTLSSGGTLSGTPTGTGTFSFTAQVTGSNGQAQKTFALRIAPSTAQTLSMSTTSFSDVTVGSTVTNLLSASGGTVPYTWTLTSGALPPGIDLAASGELLAAGLMPGGVNLFGRPYQAGLYSFSLSVTDNAGVSLTRAFTWRISTLNSQYNSLPLAGTTLVYGSAYSQPLLILGGTGSYAFAASGMPSGLTLNASTGIISGTPLVTGSYTVPVTATDTAGATLTTNVTLNIAGPGGTALNLTQINSTIQQGAATTSTITVTGGTGVGYSITATSALPPGFTLVAGASNNSATVTGVGVTPGVYTFTVRATDSAGNIGARPQTITVLPFNLLTSTTTLADASIGVPYSHQLQAIGGSASWAVTSGALPAGLTLSAGGLISGTPTAAGTFSFTATGTNGGSTSQGMSLRVSPMAIAADVLPVATFGVPYSYTFTATGGGGSKTWTLQSGLPGLSLSTAGVLSGTPSSAGSFSILVTVTDGTTPIQRRVLLPIVQQNPAVLDISATSTALTGVMVGQSTSLTLSASGGLPPYTWNVASGSSLPPGITLYSGTDLSRGAFAPGTTLLYGSPSAAGNFAFDLQVTDAAGRTAQRTFTALVSTIGLLPTTFANPVAGVAYAQQFTGVAGTAPYTFSIAPVTAGQDALPPGLTLSASGLLSGTTTSTGTYRFNLTIADSAGAAFTRTFAISPVTSAGRSITLNNTSSFVGNRFVQALNVTAATVPSVTWSVVGGSLPPGLSLVTDPLLTGGGAFLAGQPTTPGLYTYTIRATDTAAPGNTTDRTATTRVTRTGYVFPPMGTTLPFAQVGQAYSTQLRVSGGTGPYVFSLIGALDPGFSLSATGLLSGVPVSSGAHPVPFRVTDATGEVYDLTLNVVTAGAGLPAPLQATSAAPQVGVWAMGAAYTFPLDSLTTGGNGSLSWAITGGALPPGVELAPAGNGVPAYLVGRASADGDYTFTATATDAAGQSLTITATIEVSDGGLATASVPNGKVGVPYSVDLAPFGGVPPYTFGIYPFLDAPPGITVNGSGVLSGTPTRAGSYNLGVLANDSLGGEPLLKTYRLVIDNAAGEAPAVSINPRPIAVYAEQGGSMFSVPLAVESTSAPETFSVNLTGAPWASLATTAGVSPAGLSMIVNPALPVGTYTGLLALKAPESVNVHDAQPVVLTIVPPPPCTYSVSPGSGSVTAAGGTGTFSVSAGAPCAWTATASDAWITISGTPSSSGSGSVSYAVSANGAAAARSGTISVGGSVYTITQFGADCAFAISPVSMSVPASGGSAIIAVTASSACGGPPAVPWTASGLSASPSSGTGNGTVSIVIPVNPNPAARVLSATIGGQTVTINQGGAACTVSLDASSASLGSSGGVGSVAVTTLAGCEYATVTGPSWVSVTSGGSGTGPGTLVYSVAANSTTFQRSGILTIGGQPFGITQDALACSATLDTAGLSSPYGPGGGSGSVAVAMNGSNCAWSAASGAAWAGISPSSGSGSGVVLVNLGSNAASTTPRSTQLTIAGQTIEIVQAGTTCTYALLSPTASAPYLGAVGSVGVAAPAACAWAAMSADPGWLTIASATSSGNGAVTFVAQPNTSSSPRTGTLTIAGQAFTVLQAAAPCGYALSGTNTTVAAGGAGGSFSFTASVGGCAPAAASYASWLHADTSFDGSSGTVAFTADANPAGSSRVGILQLGTSTYFVTQLGSACAYSLNTYGAVFSSAAAAGNIFLGSPSALGCTPVVGVDLPSIVTLTGTDGPVLNIFTQHYDVNKFTLLTPAIRKARITFGGTIFVVKQTSW